jgi:hypothetical protein
MKSKIESLFLSYVNDFITVTAFASYYGLSLPRAHRVISLGRRINNRRA